MRRLHSLGGMQLVQNIGKNRRVKRDCQISATEEILAGSVWRLRG